MLKTAVAAMMLANVIPAHAELDCTALHAAIAQYGQATVETFAPSLGYSIEQVRWALAHCSKLAPKPKLGLRTH